MMPPFRSSGARGRVFGRSSTYTYQEWTKECKDKWLQETVGRLL